jgi:methionyl-tRNA synthetase
MLGMPGQEPWQFSGELLPSGHQTGTPALLFDKIEDPIIEEQLAKLQASHEAPRQPIPAIAPDIPFEQFQGMDLRVAKVLAAERVPKTDKLIKLTLDVGVGIRTVISGIATWYAPEDLPGLHVLYLANLAPRKIRGVESAGMVLLAEDHLGQAALVQPPAHLAPGAIVR